MARTNPLIQFRNAEECAFFFEDTQLLLIRFERDEHWLLFLIHEEEEDHLELEYPGELFEEQVRDKVETVFFVELTEFGGRPVKLALGAFFPVEDTWYGAYYPRGQATHTIYFLRVLGEGPVASLEAVEEEDEHDRVATAFTERYQGIFSFDT